MLDFHLLGSYTRVWSTFECGLIGMRLKSGCESAAPGSWHETILGTCTKSAQGLGIRLIQIYALLYCSRALVTKIARFDMFSTSGLAKFALAKKLPK